MRYRHRPDVCFNQEPRHHSIVAEPEACRKATTATGYSAHFFDLIPFRFFFVDYDITMLFRLVSFLCFPPSEDTFRFTLI